MNGQHRVKQMSQMDSVGFSHQAKQIATYIELPDPFSVDDFQPGFIFAIKQLCAGLAICSLVDQLNRDLSTPRRINNQDSLLRNDTNDLQARF
jgi:hypothetical protein